MNNLRAGKGVGCQLLSKKTKDNAALAFGLLFTLSVVILIL